jgi:hypothetical protein
MMLQVGMGRVMPLNPKRGIDSVKPTSNFATQYWDFTTNVGFTTQRTVAGPKNTGAIKR